MGKIIKNGITFSSSSDSARNIKYDDKNTKLGAYTVQTAIEKLKAFVASLTLTAPKLVRSIDQMVDRNTNYVLISTMEIYQWVEDSIVPTGIYYKTTDNGSLFDLTEFNLEIAYSAGTESIESIKQVGKDESVTTTFEYDDEGNVQAILENDGTNVIKTSITYNENGTVSDITRKIV